MFIEKHELLGPNVLLNIGVLMHPLYNHGDLRNKLTKWIFHPKNDMSHEVQQASDDCDNWTKHVSNYCHSTWPFEG